MSDSLAMRQVISDHGSKEDTDTLASEHDICPRSARKQPKVHFLLPDDYVIPAAIRIQMKDMILKQHISFVAFTGTHVEGDCRARLLFAK